ncbi:MAG: hypothetical protein ACJ8KX_14430 [Chthoniobacterales bacterium]
MILLGLFVALLTIVCAGFGVLALLLRATPRVNAFEALALAWLFGTAAVSLLLCFFGLWISGNALQTVVSASCIALGCCGYRVLSQREVKFRFPRPRNLAEWLFAVVIAVQVAFVFLMVFQYPLGWDGLLNWEIKARYAFENGGALPSTYYSDASRSFSHPDYPLYLPLLELWFYLCMGEAHQFWIKIIFAIFYAAAAILLASVAARLSGRRWIGATSAALLFFVPFLTTGYGGVLYGYADFPLAVFYLGAVGYLVISVENNSTDSLRVFAVLLALLPWVKREGALLWAVAAICGLVVIWRRKHSLGRLIWLVPGALALIGWRVFVAVMHAVRSQEFLPVSLAALVAHADRATTILHGLANETMRTDRWSLFWPLLLAAFIYLLWRIRDLRVLVLGGAIFTPVFAYCGTYFFSVWTDTQAHIATSLPRLLMQVVPLGCVAIASAFHPLRKESADLLSS